MGIWKMFILWDNHFNSILHWLHARLFQRVFTIKIKLKGQTSQIRSSREWYHWPWLVRTSLCTANTANSKQIIPEKELRGLSPSFHVHVSVSDLYIPTIGLPILLQENMWTEPCREYINRYRYIMEIMTEAARFLFWEYINGIFVTGSRF